MAPCGQLLRDNTLNKYCEPSPVSGENHAVENPMAFGYVALVPAAGRGTRLPDRQLSKELLAFGGAHGDGKPVISHLLNCIGLAGIRDVNIVLRQGKWDIPGYLTGDDWKQLRFSYKITAGTSGVPETAALGIEGFEARKVFFGFPDILFEPKDAVARLIRRLGSPPAEVVLGLFPTENPNKMDMVEVDESGRVTAIEIKPASTRLNFTWILAVWTPRFSSYLNEIVKHSPQRLRKLAEGSDGGHLGHVFQLALTDGMAIESEIFAEGRTLDIGTPEDLVLAESWAAR
jgi:glucose-1-phosphate thymidylyltransferase